MIFYCARSTRFFRCFLPLFKGVAKAALYCAHRTSTFLSCAFCDQEGHLAAPSSPLFFVLMNVDDLSRVIDFDRHLRADSDIPEHAAFGSEVIALLPS